ncbi:MAG: hypothetical protein ABIJ45_08115 [Candidatus Zixiibacteriota bacterium]
MKISLIIISIILLLTVFSQAQSIPDSTYETEAIMKLSSLLNLKISDIHFRDDYTDKDSFRLARVADLMANPYGMVAFDESLRDAASGLSAEAILRFMYDNLKRENKDDRDEFKADNTSSRFEGISLFYNNIDFNRLLMKVNDGLYRHLPEAVDSMMIQLNSKEKDFLLK